MSSAGTECRPGGGPAAPRASLEALFRASYDGLVRMVSLVADDPRDAVQEAFVEAYRRWETVSGYDDPVMWLRRVAINKALDRSRRATTERRFASRLVGQQPRTPDGATSDRLDVRSAISRLPKRQRAAVVLFYLEDLPVAEVARTMSISEGAVKAALHAARRRLHEWLEVSEDAH